MFFFLLMEIIFQSTPNGVLMAHTDRVAARPRWQLRHLVTPVQFIYRGLWGLVVFWLSHLSSRAPAEQARYPGFDSCSDCQPFYSLFLPQNTWFECPLLKAHPPPTFGSIFCRGLKFAQNNATVGAHFAWLICARMEFWAAQPQMLCIIIWHEKHCNIYFTESYYKDWSWRLLWLRAV